MHTLKDRSNASILHLYSALSKPTGWKAMRRDSHYGRAGRLLSRRGSDYRTGRQKEGLRSTSDSLSPDRRTRTASPRLHHPAAPQPTSRYPPWPMTNRLPALRFSAFCTLVISTPMPRRLESYWIILKSWEKLDSYYLVIPKVSFVLYATVRISLFTSSD